VRARCSPKGMGTNGIGLVFNCAKSVDMEGEAYKKKESKRVDIEKTKIGD